MRLETTCPPRRSIVNAYLPLSLLVAHFNPSHARLSTSTPKRPPSDRVDIAGGVAAAGPGAFAKSGKKRREAKAAEEAARKMVAEAKAAEEAAAAHKPWWRFGF